MSLDDRQRAFEEKFSHDQELLFKVQNRAHKLIGLWAAEMMSLSPIDSDHYARELVSHYIERPEQGRIFEKIKADFADKHVEMSDHRIQKMMEELHETARKQVMEQ